MILITIEVKWNVMKVHQGKLKRARITWRGPGIEIYVIGTLQGGLYAQAANLAMNYAESVHIAPSSLRSVNRARPDKVQEERLIAASGVSLKKRLL